MPKIRDFFRLAASLRMFDMLNEVTIVRIKGDVDTVIFNSVGHGTSGAVDGLALMMGKAAEKERGRREGLARLSI